MYYGWKIPLENPIPILLLNSATFIVYHYTIISKRLIAIASGGTIFIGVNLSEK